jgi:rhodanese-related sulfurtransferase
MRRSWILRLGVLVLVLTGITLLAGCASEETNTEPKTMMVSESAFQAPVVTNLSAQEAYALIQEKSDDPNFKILDVRTPDEYNTGHIEGAINIDYNSDTFKDILSKLDKSGEYLVYCRSGSRSSGAVKTMEDMKFTTIYHMGGGIIEWSAEALPFDR